MVDSGSKNKNLWIGLGAVGVLVAGALLWHYASTDDEGGDDIAELDQSEIAKQLQERGLMDVKRTETGLEPTYFIKLLQYIGETNKARTADVRAKATKERRKHYEKEEWDQYNEVVKTAFQAEDQSAQDLMAEITQAAGINPMEFQSTHQMCVQNPQMAEAVMAAQQGKYTAPDLKKKPTLTKQKTMEVFKVTQEASAGMMKTLQRLESQPLDDQEKMQLFMVEQIKLQDGIFFKTGVENEEFEESLMIFLRTDPAVQQEMQAYQMKMQMEAQKQMMGGV